MTPKKLIILFYSALVIFLSINSAVAGETKLFIPELNARSGQPIIVPVKVDQVDNLAGIKLTLEYDTALLTFEKAMKTDKTAPLMIVVNDKTPGRLIVVMAGAKGISGSNLDIIILHFISKAGLKEPVKTNIKCTALELVADDLKNISCRAESSPLVLLPDSIP